MDYVCSMRSSHFCPSGRCAGGAREREKVRDGVGLEITVAELFFREYTTRFIVHNKCPPRGGMGRTP